MTNHHHSSKKRKTRQRNGDSLHRDDRSLDHSQIGETLNLGTKNVAQIACALANGTEEVKDLLLNECNIIYECRHCKNFFRSFANLVTHKRAYCKGHECEQMALYDPSWFAPEQKTKNTDEEVRVVPDVATSICPQTKLVTKIEQKKIFEAKRNALHSIVNSIKKSQSSDSEKSKATMQFYSNETQNEKDETSNATQSQRLTRQSLMQTASPESGYTSIEESTLNTETSNQKTSEKTFLSIKSETEDIIKPSILKEYSQITSDPIKVEIQNESLLPANENSSSSSKTITTTSMIPTPIGGMNKHRPNGHSIQKCESHNAVQKSPQFSEKKPQKLKMAKPVLSGNNVNCSLLNHHYDHSRLHPSNLSKESSSSGSTSFSSSSTTSIQSDSNDLECPEQVCTQTHKSAISNGKNRRNDAHERPIRIPSSSCIPVEVITID